GRDRTPVTRAAAPHVATSGGRGARTPSRGRPGRAGERTNCGPRTSFAPAQAQEVGLPDPSHSACPASQAGAQGSSQEGREPHPLPRAPALSRPVSCPRA
ncbi:hypothetical protein H1C71_036232, partial [Ictidomys tridecemlineatus]